MGSREKGRLAVAGPHKNEFPLAWHSPSRVGRDVPVIAYAPQRFYEKASDLLAKTDR